MGDGIGDGSEAQITIGICYLQRHYATAAGDARDAYSVVCFGCGYTRTGGPVPWLTRIIHGIGIIVTVIVASHQAQIRVSGVNTGIDDSNYY
ncbi:MAG: hypothetical protein BWX83_00580 [Candidatus Cloacimonetes bacterium ADurb.Bin117]|nr:MAG: hypothetical protein BWX83_00580 [Candidatus Cloacimonetes bacterium ADurb.Bin117]